MDLTLLAGLYLGILLFKCGSACWVAARAPRRAATDFAGAATGVATEFSTEVAILQPILSGDPMLAEQLASNVRDCPGVTFVWLIDQADRAAETITTDIQARFPSARILIQRYPAAPEGVNPKSYKLEQAWRDAPGVVCVVLDDDTRLLPDTLVALVEAADDHTLATALPHYHASAEPASRWLAEFVNNNAAFTYLSLLPYTQPISINGMCYAIRRAHLERCGGFRPILSHLADDLALANLVTSRGGRIRQLPDAVAVRTSLSGYGDYIRQMHRWFLFASLLLKPQSLAWRLLILVLHGLPPLLLWMLLVGGAMAAWQGLASALSVLAVLGVRAAAIAGCQRLTTGAIRHRPGLSLLSELMQPFHLMHALLVRSITWRTRRYRVYSNEHFVSE